MPTEKKQPEQEAPATLLPGKNEEASAAKQLPKDLTTVSLGDSLPPLSLGGQTAGVKTEEIDPRLKRFAEAAAGDEQAERILEKLKPAARFDDKKGIGTFAPFINVSVVRCFATV